MLHIISHDCPGCLRSVGVGYFSSAHLSFCHITVYGGCGQSYQHKQTKRFQASPRIDECLN